MCEFMTIVLHTASLIIVQAHGSLLSEQPRNLAYKFLVITLGPSEWNDRSLHYHRIGASRLCRDTHEIYRYWINK